MLLEHRGKRPIVDESAYVAPSVVVCGAVIVGPGTRILHGAVLSAEDGDVRLGENVIVMETISEARATRGDLRPTVDSAPANRSVRPHTRAPEVR